MSLHYVLIINYCYYLFIFIFYIFISITDSEIKLIVFSTKMSKRTNKGYLYGQRYRI
jgi:hypothetical protein